MPAQLVTKSLRGRQIAVTRARREEDALSARLLALGAQVLYTPAIEIVPPVTYEALDSALLEVAEGDVVIFSSARAVESVILRCEALGLGLTALMRARLAAVGSATASRLRQALRAPDDLPEQAAGAEALATALSEVVRGRRVVVPRAEGGRPELLEALVRAGAKVEAPVAYRTLPVSPERLRALSSALAARALDAVTFASPSAVHAVLAALVCKESLADVVLGAIGPTTASALRAHGLEVGVEAPQATGAALAEALAEKLGALPS